MCSSTTDTSNRTLEGGKLVKFVELLVHDYLQAKGFTATGEKFAEECSKCARDRDGDSSSRKHRGVASSVGSAGSTVGIDEPAVDDASSWYYLADKLALEVGVSRPTSRRRGVHSQNVLVDSSSTPIRAPPPLILEIQYCCNTTELLLAKIIPH